MSGSCRFSVRFFIPQSTGNLIFPTINQYFASNLLNIFFCFSFISRMIGTLTPYRGLNCSFKCQIFDLGQADLQDQRGFSRIEQIQMDFDAFKPRSNEENPGKDRRVCHVATLPFSDSDIMQPRQLTHVGWKIFFGRNFEFFPWGIIRRNQLNLLNNIEYFKETLERTFICAILF